MRSLRLARNHSKSEHKRLVYEGWILYDTGHHEEALAKAEEFVSIQRSFEAYFLKAYALADSTLNPKSSKYVIQLLEEALRCPSDGLRKGQVSEETVLHWFDHPLCSIVKSLLIYRAVSATSPRAYSNF
ncbi:tetratricopeptide repeat (TPR)-containing protein [Raphanus sativus]|nr:tetratricopeptide repeat (TPR)-containing protein [Raphanus sativus]